MTDHYNIHSQLEHLQYKHCDSCCSCVGHFNLLNYIAIVENETKARVRFNMIEKVLQPCRRGARWPASKPKAL